MVQLAQPVNCHEVEPAGTFVPFEGQFRAHIVDSEMKATKKGDGEYLALKVEVIDGPNKGRTVYDNLNLNNPSEKAMEIAYQTLSAIGHATGVMNITNSEQVHNIPMMVTFAVDGSYTRIKGYEPASAAAAAAPAPAAQAQAPAAAPAASLKPWERKAS